MGSDVFIHFLAPWRKPLSQTKVILTFELDISPITGRDESVKGQGWGCIYKTLPMSKVSEWKAKWRYWGCGEMKPKSSSAMLYAGTVIHRPAKQSCPRSGRPQPGRCVWWRRNSTLFHAHLKFALIIKHPNGLKSTQSAKGRKPASILWQPVLKHHCLSMDGHWLKWA